ncbi:hypothetical protein MGWOODY_Smn1057 [hydrothermal vent metagenome]|uniref:Uncharacterized protein n=1 Tax=hydrothermal vent metagenome TaxID=652676 RepID=A0A170PP20_9ZZZZ
MAASIPIRAKRVPPVAAGGSGPSGNNAEPLVLFGGGQGAK